MNQESTAPKWPDLTPVEKVAVASSVLLFIGGVLAGPYLLCRIADRPQAEGWGERIFDALVVELLGLVLLVLWPLKSGLKKWLHGTPDSPPPAKRSLRLLVAGLWIVATLGTIAFVTPQLFFLLTNRATATSGAAIASDAVSMLLATLPQIAATLPYVLVVTRTAGG